MSYYKKYKKEFPKKTDEQIIKHLGMRLEKLTIAFNDNRLIIDELIEELESAYHEIDELKREDVK